MNRYTLTKKLGDGTYGSVIKAVNRQTGEEVAVKKMKKLFTRCVIYFVFEDKLPPTFRMDHVRRVAERWRLRSPCSKSNAVREPQRSFYIP